MRQMTEEDLRHKIEDRRKGYNVQQNWGSGVGQSSGLAMKCFNCNDYGHHHSTCKKPPFCYSCRESGHKSNQCPLMKSNKGLRLCAYGMPGQIFYALDLPEPKAEAKPEIEGPIRAIVSILEGRGTKFRVKTELQYLMDSNWDWDVKRISGSEFLVNLPSKVALNLLIKMKKSSLSHLTLWLWLRSQIWIRRCFRFFSLCGLELLAFQNLLELSLLLWSLPGWWVIQRRCMYRLCNGKRCG